MDGGGGWQRHLALVLGFPAASIVALVHFLSCDVQIGILAIQVLGSALLHRLGVVLGLSPLLVFVEVYPVLAFTLILLNALE